MIVYTNYNWNNYTIEDASDGGYPRCNWIGFFRCESEATKWANLAAKLGAYYVAHGSGFAIGSSCGFLQIGNEDSVLNVNTCDLSNLTPTQKAEILNLVEQYQKENKPWYDKLIETYDYSKPARYIVPDIASKMSYTLMKYFQEKNNTETTQLLQDAFRDLNIPLYFNVKRSL